MHLCDHDDFHFKPAENQLKAQGFGGKENTAAAVGMFPVVEISWVLLSLVKSRCSALPEFRGAAQEGGSCVFLLDTTIPPRS